MPQFNRDHDQRLQATVGKNLCGYAKCLVQIWVPGIVARALQRRVHRPLSLHRVAGDNVIPPRIQGHILSTASKEITLPRHSVLGSFGASADIITRPNFSRNSRVSVPSATHVQPWQRMRAQPLCRRPLFYICRSFYSLLCTLTYSLPLLSGHEVVNHSCGDQRHRNVGQR